jgi:hypothetical protein
MTHRRSITRRLSAGLTVLALSAAGLSAVAPATAAPHPNAECAGS